MMSAFAKLKEILSKSRQIFQPAETNRDLKQIEEILLRADVGFRLTEHLISELRRQVPENFHNFLINKISKILTPEKPFSLPSYKPAIILIVGVPGSGKTTTVAKLAYYFTRANKKVLISASDTYRAAAAEQLAVWAQRTSSELVYSQSGQNPSAVTFDALKKAQSQSFDIALIDTAGRLHTRKDLIEEVKKIKRVIQKFRPNAPDEILLVIDATVGQNGITQAKVFHQELNITGLIITKLDGTAKGGIVIPIAWELNLPIRFIGVGEQIEDLLEFNPREYLQALLGS
jgi:fused signal recognition particle receptor